MDNQIKQVESFIQAFNSGNIDAVHQYLSREFINYVPAEGENTAAEELFKIAKDLKGAYPDLAASVEKLTTEGDLLTGELTLSGNRSASLWGGPDTPKQVTWTVPIEIRFYGDKFTFAPIGLEIPQIFEIGRQLNIIPPADKMDQPPPFPVSIPDFLLKLIFTGQAQEKECSHVHDIKFIEPTTDVCEQCVQSDDIWPALRMCVTCGFVGCCDTSKNKHMSQHYKVTGHPLFRSIRLDEGWMWCYEHNAFFPKERLHG